MMVVDYGSLDPSQDHLLLCLVTVRGASTIVDSTNKGVSAAVVRGIWLAVLVHCVMKIGVGSTDPRQACLFVCRCCAGRCVGGIDDGRSDQLSARVSWSCRVYDCSRVGPAKSLFLTRSAFR